MYRNKKENLNGSEPKLKNFPLQIRLNFPFMRLNMSTPKGVDQYHFQAVLISYHKPFMQTKAGFTSNHFWLFFGPVLSLEPVQEKI